MTCDHLERRIFYEWAVVSTGVSGLTTWVPPRPFLALVRSYLSDSSLVFACLILCSICLILVLFVGCAARRKVDPGALLVALRAPGRSDGGMDPPPKMKEPISLLSVFDQCLASAN